MRVKEYNSSNHFSLTQDDLTNAGFKYGFNPIAVAKQHGKDAAKDYGRRGREIIVRSFYKNKRTYRESSILFFR